MGGCRLDLSGRTEIEHVIKNELKGYTLARCFVRSQFRVNQSNDRFAMPPYNRVQLPWSITGNAYKNDLPLAEAVTVSISPTQLGSIPTLLHTRMSFTEGVTK